MFNPYWTHPLTAIMRFILVWLVLLFLLDIASHTAIFIALAYVCGYYEGRESGQREHDLKHMQPKPWSEFMAWLGAEFYFGWSVDNFLQALAGWVGGLVIAVIIWFWI